MEAAFPDTPLRVERGGDAARLILNRPARRNAIDPAMIAALDAAIADAASDRAVRVVTITGSGSAFCAGADLISAGATDSAAILAFIDSAGQVFDAIRACPKPVIAAINGLALAGGLELALACDIIIAAEEAMIGDGHATYGMFPGAGGAALLPGRIGYHAAMHLLCTGRTLPASRLMALGLVQDIAPSEQFAELVARTERDIAVKSQAQLAAVKQVARNAACASDAASLAAERNAFAAYCGTPDFAEGLAAFAEKRAPRFGGAST